MIDAVIFDMDGLLIDSEPFWGEAEVEVLGRVGVPLTHAQTKGTMGLRVDEVVRHWHERYPWDEPSQQAVVEQIIERVIGLIQGRGEPMPGVYPLLGEISARRVPMAIASSSYMPIILAVVEKLEIGGYLHVIHSAEHEPYGKPHPGVFITAAERLGVPPTRCLVFEDSPYGVLAAKAARMHCVAVPETRMIDDKGFCIADAVIGSLEEFSLSLLGE